MAVIRREVDWIRFTVLVADPRTTTDGTSSSLPGKRQGEVEGLAHGYGYCSHFGGVGPNLPN